MLTYFWNEWASFSFHVIKYLPDNPGGKFPLANSSTFWLLSRGWSKMFHVEQVLKHVLVSMSLWQCWTSTEEREEVLDSFSHEFRASWLFTSQCSGSREECAYGSRLSLSFSFYLHCQPIGMVFCTFRMGIFPLANSPREHTCTFRSASL